MLSLPTKGFFKRMRIYFSEMFPPVSRLISAGLVYISFTTLLCEIHHAKFNFFSQFTLLGIWNIFALLLILRLMDELKDKEIDLRLFKERPLPSGKVKEPDIVLSLVTMIVLFLGANFWPKSLFWAALIILAYSLLMFKYFFIPHILRKYLLLNLATHNPVVALILLLVTNQFRTQYSLSLIALKWTQIILLITMYWAMFFAWEIGRKIRSKEEENEYVTYSQVLGRNGAMLVTWGAQTVAFIIGLYFFQAFSFSAVFIAIIAAGYAVTVWAHLRFLLNPTPTTSKLKPFVERYITSVLIAGIVNYALIS